MLTRQSQLRNLGLYYHLFEKMEEFVGILDKQTHPGGELNLLEKTAIQQAIEVDTFDGKLPAYLVVT